MKSRLWNFVLGVSIFCLIMAAFLGDILDQNTNWFKNGMLMTAFLVGGSVVSGLFFWKLNVIGWVQKRRNRTHE